MSDLIDKDAVSVETLDVSDHPEYKGHEFLFRMTAQRYGFTAFVGVHNTVLGPGEGGIRYHSYQSEENAITDVLRLCEGMTLKNAAAGLSAGGGKAVVMAHPDKPKPDETILQLLAHGLNKVNENKPLYYGAEDMNISEHNLDYMLDFTTFVKGATSGDPLIVGGNPSPLTALGVFEAMKLAVQEKFEGEKELSDLTVSLQGVGSVGRELARLLYSAGATLYACDVFDGAFDKLASQGVKIERVGLTEIYDVKADIFAPNAIGGTLDYDTVERLDDAGVKIVCGAANNQQHDQIGHLQSREMMSRGIMYCPDFIVNAGGIIWVNQVGEDATAVRARVIKHMPISLKRIIDFHKQSGMDMGSVAEEYALGLVV
ncbi:MAG: hypothetical protein KTR28_06515 [Micavibrio sp.]|nr:hypothetical protein [Micavibrio sp.]